MNDPRFNSIHLEANPRREEFRRARARLLGACGFQTLACDRDRVAESGECGPQTIVEKPGELPAECKFWLADKDGIYPLKPGLNSVGRMPDNDVVVADGSVSRRHCAIVVHLSRGCEVHDTASKNGTLLNGKRIAGPTKLVCGDELRLCDHVVIFQSEQNPPAEETPSRCETLG
jgi:hypothetical protein